MEDNQTEAQISGRNGDYQEYRTKQEKMFK